MGTGIISVGLALDHLEPLSRGLLVIAAVVWVALGLVFCWRVIRDRASVIAEAQSPAGLTGIAGTAVLGTGFANGAPALGVVLLAVVVVGLPALAGLVLRRLARNASGDWFMLIVATEGPAALAAELAVPQRAAWLCGLAAGLAIAGVVLYPVVLMRFDARELVTGRGDHWVGGGSLAISALAFAQIALSSRHLRVLQGAIEPTRDVALVSWVGAMLWLVPLLISELRWPRLGYQSRRWSTVFPLGMYAVCSFNVAAATGSTPIFRFARGWIWVAVMGWALTFGGMLRRGLRLLARGVHATGNASADRHAV